MCEKVIITVMAAFLTLSGAISGTQEAAADREQKVSPQISYLNVRSFCQDSAGYMWIATLHGLNRYNGYEFFRYFHDATDSTSLDHDQVFSVYFDSSRRLWVGTLGGVDRYDFLNDRFIRYKNKANLNYLTTINSFFEDHTGRIWLATHQGPGWIDTEHQEFHLSPDYLYSVLSLWEDEANRLWMGTHLGMVEYGNDSVRAHYPLPDNRQITSQVYIDPQGRWWLGTNAGLCWFDPLSRSFVPAPASCLEHPKLRKTRVNFITEIDRMQLLIGTESQGIFLYDMFSQTLQPGEPWQLNRMDSREFLACTVDRESNVWLASYDKGFTVWNKSLAYFNADHKLSDMVNDKFVTRIVEDRYGNLWVSTRYHGLFVYRVSGDISVYNANNSAWFEGDESPIESLFIDSRNRIWIGMADRLIAGVLSPDGHITRVSRKNMNYVRMMKEDKAGNLWAGTWEGLYRIKNKHTPSERIERVSSIANIPDLCILDSGDILFSAYGKGIFRLPAGDSIPEILDAPEAALDVMRYCVTLFGDSQERIWFGSYLNGCLCRSKDGYRVYTKNDGLPSNNILCFQEDLRGNIWMSTSHGISYLNFTDTIFTTYTKSDGMPGNQYHEKGGMKHSDGRIFFTGNHGLTFFYPLKTLSKKRPPSIRLEDLKILNRSVLPGQDNGVLPVNIAYTRRITLNHRQSNFSLDYTGIDFLSPDKLTYACKLEGFDEDWNKVGNFRRASYSNLPAGKYTFMVKAINSEGVESTQPAKLQITIQSAPWFSLPAWILYVCVFFSIVFILFRQSLKMKMNRSLLEIEHNEREREREVSEMKMHFFTNISHELRTPLTLISAPLEQLLTLNPSDKTGMRLLDTISRNVQSMLRLINQLLDFRKMENGILDLQVQQEDLIRCIRNILDVFVFPAEKKQIHLYYTPHSPEFVLWVDMDKLEKILHNLLSNALKHTPEKGTVTVTTNLLTYREAILKYAGISGNAEYSYMEITVSDTGPGVPEDKLKELFIRYGQISGPPGFKPDYGGSGIGLHYTKRLVEIHKGRIEAKNKPEGGMSFSFILPTGDIYRENEIKANQEVITVADCKKNDAAIASQGREKPYTILIIEDNAELMDFICNLLTADYELLTATDGEKAWNIVQETLPDLILSDVLMPGISGYKFCAKIKNDPAFCHIPVILLTAKSTPTDQIEGLEQGADAYICKPFHVDYLLLTIKNLFMMRDRLRQYYSTPQTKEETPVPVRLNAYDRKFMDKMMLLLEKELDNPEFNVDAIGRELGFSRTAFYRKIKGLTDMTPIDFLRSYRLRRAAEMLQQNEGSLTDVSEKTGFSSYSYFSKSFRKHFGVTPKNYK
jgi:signal transduction histidine kinase/ligand-binding sensor domain-containing protein/DNA-binding response OmpR family regulator